MHKQTPMIANDFMAGKFYGIYPFVPRSEQLGAPVRVLGVWKLMNQLSASHFPICM